MPSMSHLSALGAALLVSWPSLAAKPAHGVIHVFDAGSGDGQTPLAGLIADGSGALYGTTFAGGANQAGTVYKLVPPLAGSTVWTETRLHDFPSSLEDGTLIKSSLIFDKSGALYGVAYEGGKSSGSNSYGVVFKLTPPAPGATTWSEMIIHTFDQGNGPMEGANPLGGLVSDASGAIYGVTEAGGLAGFGTVFKLSPPGTGQTVWTETVLYSFLGGSDAGGPEAKLAIDNQGNLYGTTQDQGIIPAMSCGYIGCGTVFRLAPPAAGQSAWTETVIYRFSGRGDGYRPFTDVLVDRMGRVFGTTYYGGLSTIAQCSGGCGTVFELLPPAAGASAWTHRIIHNFAGTPDGSHPLGGLIPDAAGNLYGTTAAGGVAGSSGCGYGCGISFKLSPPLSGQTEWLETVMAPPTRAGGFAPDGDLLLQPSGTLFGVMSNGPKNNGGGTVFRLKAF